MIKIFILIFSTLIFSVKADIFQCDNGEFRDTPCPTAGGKKIQIASENITQNKSKPNDISQPITSDEFRRAIAKIAILHSEIRRCADDIVIDKKTNCNELMVKTQPYGELEQSMKIVKDSSNDKVFYNKNRSEIETAFNRNRNIINAKTLIEEAQK